MRRFFVIAAAAALFATTAVSPDVTRATITTPYAVSGSQAVVDGVTHEWGTSQAEYIDAVSGPETTTQSINVVRVDTSTSDIHFETSLPRFATSAPHGQVNARETTTEQAMRESVPGHRVVAAINGDFWRTRNGRRSPIDLNIRNGELVANAPGERGAVGFMADGTPIIGRPLFAASMTMPDASVIELGAVNQIRDADEVVLYTRTFGSTTATDAAGVEVVLSGVTLPLPVSGAFTGTVEGVFTDVTSTPIPSDSVVLSTTGIHAEALASLAPDDTVQINLSIDEPWQDVVNAVGGLRILVHEGVAATDFSTPPEIYRNSRTAAGITADGDVVLVTVDGSENGSTGLVQADLAQLMVSLGAVEAINLDGGGSSTMVVDPDGAAPLGIVNVPADGYERRVNTALLVVSTAADPEPVVPTVTAPIMRFTSGQATTAGKGDALVDISWHAADGDGVVVATELEKLDAGVWLPVDLASPTATTINRRLKFKTDFQFRVRVTDDDGNQSDWVQSLIYRINAVNERASAIVRTGKWPIVERSSAIGGLIGRNSAKLKPGQTASLSYAAVQVAWIGPRSELSGTAQVELDGFSAGTLTLTRSKSLARAVLFVGPALDGPTANAVPSRTIKVTNLSTRARPFVDLDAFLLLTAR